MSKGPKHPNDLAGWLEQRVDEVREHLADTLAYMHTKAEFMFQLEIGRPQRDVCFVVLQVRERLIYHDGTTYTDILAVSGIDLATSQLVARMPARDAPDADPGPTMVTFRRQGGESAAVAGFGAFVIARGDLLAALNGLFAFIRRCEERIILHPVGYTATGIGRRAHVSVTNMGVLRCFDDPILQEMGDTYHTIDERWNAVRLPPATPGGAAVVIRRGSPAN